MEKLVLKAIFVARCMIQILLACETQLFGKNSYSFPIHISDIKLHKITEINKNKRENLKLLKV